MSTQVSTLPITGVYNRTYQYPDHYEVEVTSIHREAPAIFKCSLEDLPLLRDHHWRLTDNGYVKADCNGNTHLFHDLVAPSPKGMSTDHIDRDRLNNVRTNLRPATKGMQSRNKCSKEKKEAPKGVVQSIASDGCRASWTINGIEYHEWFPASKYGRAGALKEAMRARMKAMIADDGYANDAFPITLINRALEEEQAPSLPLDAPVQSRKAALSTLYRLGYNLWNIYLNGKYAHYIEKPDWSVKGTQGYAIKATAEIVDHLATVLSGDELMKECVALEDDVRELKQKYMIMRRRDGERVVDLAPSGPAEVQDAPKPSVSDAMSAAKAEVMGLAAPPSEEQNRAAMANQVRISIEAEMVTIINLSQMLIKGGKTTPEQVHEAVHKAVRALEKLAAPPKETKEEETTKIKEYKVSPTTEKWIDSHIRHQAGSVAVTTDVNRGFESWYKSRMTGKPDGSVKIAYIMRRRGFATTEKKIYLDCELISDDAPSANSSTASGGK